MSGCVNDLPGHIVMACSTECTERVGSKGVPIAWGSNNIRVVG